MLKHRTQSTALVPIDDDVDNLPFIVRRDHRIVAGFARKAAAIEGGRDALVERREPLHRPHRAADVIVAY